MITQAKRIVGALIDALPERLAVRLNPAKYGYAWNDVPQPPEAPQTPVRLYIAPVNFAGQGWEWARAAEMLPGVGAVSMHYLVPGDFGFPGDNIVPVNVFARSRSWQRDQFERVASSFTHVLIEAERPIFGSLFGGDVVAEVHALQGRGVKVGMISHGSDLRLPSRHRELDKWSPFHDVEWREIDVLERQATAHREVLAAISAPVFVSTSDLVEDWPAAQLLPVVVEPTAWQGGNAPLRNRVPVVLHAPSKAHIKGTHLVEPLLQRLHVAGLIEYRQVQGIPAAEMPAHVKQADIVVEQFRIGCYSRAAVEGLAAGRVVVGHVHDQVREHVREVTGRTLPIVEATPETLEEVLHDMMTNRERFQEVAAAGPRFASEIHDGRFSAQVLARAFLEIDEVNG
ncbi:glycosyltransferase [Leucobacter sp. 1207-22]|uniref:glycosyltransferase n=1 Tax=Leucobacter sp. 1207-22 TaxID=2604456 RepID=UPI004062BB97